VRTASVAWFAMGPRPDKSAYRQLAFGLDDEAFWRKSHRTSMNARLIVSLLVGFGFAFLSWLFFGSLSLTPYHFGGFWQYLGILITILSLPGLFTGMIASGNVHGGSMAVTVLVNFLFYFLATRSIFKIWERQKEKSHRLAAPAGNQRPDSMT